MKKYRIVMNGKNLWLKVEGKAQCLGFYTTRFVHAPNLDIAETNALQMVKDDPGLLPNILNDPSDPPVIVVEEVEEIDSSAGVETANSGYTFYPEENNA